MVTLGFVVKLLLCPSTPWLNGWSDLNLTSCLWSKSEVHIENSQIIEIVRGIEGEIGQRQCSMVLVLIAVLGYSFTAN